MSKPKFGIKNQSKNESQDKKNLKKNMKAKGPPPKKKSVKVADKDVRTKIANGELVKV